MKYLSFLLFILSSSLLWSQSVKLDSSKLPICIVDTRGQTILNEPKILANMKIIYNGPGKTNYINNTKYHYNNNIAIEIRGNSSQSYPQKQYGLELRDSISGQDIDSSLIGMPADEDWVLYAPYNDISLLRNVLAYQLWNQMGHWGPRTRFCELILNNSYQGIYILTESIKRSVNRVDIAKLKIEDSSGIELTGGYIMKIDKKNSATDKSFISKVKSTNNQNITWLYHYPESDDITSAQENYIHRYIDTVEQVLASSNFADPINGYSKYLSTKSFMDYFLLTEFSRNIDAYKASSYFYKEKAEADGSGGQFKAGPVWDFNFAFGNASFCTGGPSTGWMYDGCTPATLPTPILWKRLLTDVNYLNELKCRYNALRKTVLDTTNIFTLLDLYSKDSLNQAQKRHFAKWPILGTNPGGFNAYIASSYEDEMSKLKNWIRSRLQWMDVNLQGTCTPALLKLQIPLQIPCNTNAIPTLPKNHPFTNAPFNYSGQEKFTKINSDVKRWVLVELRSSKDSTKLIDRRAGLLKSDNTVVDTNLSNTLFFPNAAVNENYFILIRYDEKSFIFSKTAVKIPNISSLNLTLPTFTTVPSSTSPLVFKSDWLGIDSISICQGHSFMLNDSNLVKAGFNGLQQITLSPGLGLKDLDEHQIQITGINTGNYVLNWNHLCPGNYYIKTSLKITVLESPKFSISGTDKLCDGQSVNWMVNANKVRWSNGMTTPVIELSNPGNYSVTVTSENGCSAEASQLLKAIPPILGKIEHVSFWSSSECKFYFIPSANYGPLTYVWSNQSTTDTVITSLPAIKLVVTDTFGCTKEFSADCNPLLTQPIKLHPVKIFPNPSSYEIHVESDDIQQINLCNAALGSIIELKSNDLNHSNTINVSKLNQGLYFLIVKTGHETQVFKLVIE